MKRLLLPAILVLAVATGGAGAAPGASVGQMAGQLMLVRMQGQTPSSSFLARVRHGEIGGVVLFANNYGARGPRNLIATLQAAAKAGHQPPLLVAVDQEGGIVKRLPGAPTLAPSAMRTASIAAAQGLATARNLGSQGVNVDLAPVLDVGHGGFITSRTFGPTPSLVSQRGTAFAVGLARGHVLATAKHFPGLGHAVVSTDATDTKVAATAPQLKADWLPFRTAIEAGIPLVMMSTAVYPALGSSWPAALSPNVVADLRGLGFKGVVVTDALQTPAINKVMTTAKAAVNAVGAGDDLVLAAGPSDDDADTDAASVSAYDALVAAVRSGRIDTRVLAAAYARVVALKERL